MKVTRGTLGGTRSILSAIPFVGARIRRHARPMYPFFHRIVLFAGKRENYTFTQFLRLPHQYDALAGPVVDFFLRDKLEPLRIVIFGCSNGAEPYSIASVLRARRPDVNFEIEATDIDPKMLEQASVGRYSREEVMKNPAVSPDFVQANFVEDGDTLVVRPEIRERVSFGTANVLDADLKSKVQPADIVVAQNFLYHLSPRASRRAFRNLSALLKPRAVLFIDGMDLDSRCALTEEAGLQPLDHLIKEIHNDGLILRGGAWPWIYWGLEPLNTGRGDWKHRYATIYLNDNRT